MKIFYPANLELRRFSYSMLKRLYQPEFFILLFFCIIFYAAMHYYAEPSVAQLQSTQALQKIMLLRMVFSCVFAAFIGFLGVKLSGRIWPAATVHAIVVAVMLMIDIPFEDLLINWNISLLIIAIMASITTLFGGITLAFYWLRMRKYR